MHPVHLERGFSIGGGCLQGQVAKDAADLERLADVVAMHLNSCLSECEGPVNGAFEKLLSGCHNCCRL